MGEEGGDGGAAPLGDLDPADDISLHSKALAEKARAFCMSSADREGRVIAMDSVSGR